jgi:hypothetical protein
LNTKKRTSGALLGVIPQLVDALLHLVEFALKVDVIDDGRRLGDVAEQLHQFVQLEAVVLHGVAHQVVAVGTVDAAPLAVVLVLLALVASLALHVVLALQKQIKK